MNFFPDPDAPTTNALNAVVRFSVYGGVLLYFVTNEQKYLYAIPLVLLGTYLAMTLYPPKEHMTLKDNIKHMNCARPTKENPMMNVMIHEIGDTPDRPPACNLNRPENKKDSDEFLFGDLPLDDERDKAALRRQFVSMPVTTVINDTKKFAQFLFGENPKKHIGFN